MGIVVDIYWATKQWGKYPPYIPLRYQKNGLFLSVYQKKMVRNYNPDARFCHIGYSKVNPAPSMLFTVLVSIRKSSYF